MKRIGIQWHKDSMLGDTLRGTVTVLEGKTTITADLAGSLHIEVSKGSILTRSTGEGPPLQLSAKHRNLLYTMARCYHAGLVHSGSIYHWVDV